MHRGYPKELDSSRREALGMVFTEKSLADFIVESAFRHLEEDFLRSCPKVVEPSVGGGSFCLALLERVKQEIEKMPLGQREREKLFLSFAQGLYGVDIEESAVRLAADNLRRAEQRLGLEGFVWEKQLGVKDFLFSELSDFQAEKEGVSLIIGNPPYIGEKGSKELFRRMKRTDFGREYYEKGMDYFYYFIEKGLDLLREGGLLAYITTSYWTRADSASKLRDCIGRQAGFAEVIDFQDLRLFEDAKGHNSLVFILKKGYCGSFRHHRVLSGKKRLPEIFRQIRAVSEGEFPPSAERGCRPARREEKRTSLCREEGSPSPLLQTADCDNETTIGFTPYFIFLPREDVAFIRRLQELSPRSLAQMAEINQGIVSGADKVTEKNIVHLPRHPVEKGEIQVGDGIFVLDEEEKKRLCERIGDQPPEIVPFYKNSSINAYRLRENSRYLLYLDGSEGEEHVLVAGHLSRYRGLLERRREVILGHLPYYALHWSRRRSIFTGEKILVPQRALRPTFAYSDAPVYASADVYFINQMRKDPFFLLAYLSSEPVERYLHYLGKRKGRYHELYSKPLGEIPVLSLPPEEEKALAAMAKAVHRSFCDREREKLLCGINELLWEKIGRIR